LKLLVDENLPPRLVHDLADLFPDSAHVHPLGLDCTPDELIWEYARTHGFAFLTKDKDFASLSLARGAPPKVILLQTGNCSTDEVLSIVRTNAIRLAELEGDAQRALLILR
jgi:predicted nuclease of predicted toxin-antitoxin system